LHQGKSYAVCKTPAGSLRLKGIKKLIVFE